MAASNLTEKQKAFLEKCEKDFADKYTEKDKEFMQFKNAPAVPPPCMHPWNARPPRNRDPNFRENRGGGFSRDHSRGSRDYNRDRGYDRNDRGYDRNDRGYNRNDRGYDRNDRNDRSHDRDRDRDRGHDRRRY